MIRITFSKAHVKRLQQELEKAYAYGDERAVRHLSVLLMVGNRIALEMILSVWNVSQQTVYNWLNDFLAYRWDSLEYCKAPGRPPRLTKSQKRKLSKWIEDGSEACGYPTGCWTSLLIQDLIYRKFHVLYNRFYVCELLRNLDFSFQKACFVSDHLDEEARRHWMKKEFPKILRQAQQLGAPVYFGDEASFALWGSLSYTWARRGQQPQSRPLACGKATRSLVQLSFSAVIWYIKERRPAFKVKVIKRFSCICFLRSPARSS